MGVIFWLRFMSVEWGFESFRWWLVVFEIKKSCGWKVGEIW